jgi:hypothetical protein
MATRSLLGRRAPRMKLGADNDSRMRANVLGREYEGAVLQRVLDLKTFAPPVEGGGVGWGRRSPLVKWKLMVSLESFKRVFPKFFGHPPNVQPVTMKVGTQQRNLFIPEIKTSDFATCRVCGATISACLYSISAISLEICGFRQTFLVRS